MVVPHLSTGGLPQYTLRMIERMRGEYAVWCVEWDDITGGVLVVQRNAIGFWLNGRSSGDRLVTLGGDKHEFLRLIDSIEPDVIHFQEIPETFVPVDILEAVWWEDRAYDIVMTTHSSHTDPERIRWAPDRFVLVSEWSRKRFAAVYGEGMCQLWEYREEARVFDKAAAREKLGFDPGKTHVLHVGLFTPGKNQRQLFEIAREMEAGGAHEFHFVGNQADNFRDYWEPLMREIPSNCTWHGERSDVSTFYMASDVFIFPSLFELNPLSLIEARAYGLSLVIRNLDTYEDKYADVAHYIGDDVAEAAAVLASVSPLNSQPYDDVKRNELSVRRPDPAISVDFIEGPKINIGGAPGDVFDVTFRDASTGMVHYVCEVGNDCWARANLKYALDWEITAKRRADGKEFVHRFDPSGKRVYVALDSRSIGDTLAWFPQLERFRAEKGCNLVCSTFWNGELAKNYPEIEFVPPGSVVHGLYAMFVVGWFFEGDSYSAQMHPRDFKVLPLGQTAADILGIDYAQTRARIDAPAAGKARRVGMGFHSTAQTKYWNNPDGWQQVTNFLTRMGYEVVVMSNEGDGYMGNRYPDGAVQHPQGDFESLKEAISSCEFFIGLGSGLSWLAWTLGVPTVLISGFSWPESEFEGPDVLRIFNESACNGCYNRYRFNPGDWNWCPDHKGTERQFECTKSITGNMVISKIVERGWVSF